MNILVTGGCGQLGCMLRYVAEGSEHNFIYTSLNGKDDVRTLDITDKDAVKKMVKDNSIDVILNFAGYTNVEQAELEEEAAFKANAEAVGLLAASAKGNSPSI